MLIVLSPAKSLDFDTPVPPAPASQPDWLDRSQRLIGRLRDLSPSDIARLMDISDPLALINFHRFADWSLPFNSTNARQAVLAFDGDVYDGLAARTMNADDLAFAQTTLRILSGLYGILRPLDLMQPYRLEMGTKLVNEAGRDLYAFWGDTLRRAIEAELVGQVSPVLVNLASEEYFKALQPKKLACRVIQPVFEDWQGGRFRIVSFFAKRARGLMARHVVLNRLNEPEGLKDFDADGYAYVAAASDEDRPVFRRQKA